MSEWCHLTAIFEGPDATAERIKQKLPQGSESGADVREGADAIFVDGDLRDVSDLDSPAILAWFIAACFWATKARIEWDFDDGPRYRYWWEKGQLTKIKGVLDA